MDRERLKPAGNAVWEIAPTGSMRVPVRIYAQTSMLDGMLADAAPEQAVNVACLPGIVRASLAMPDMHWGYGFPIGGVAAFDVEEGVVSPGGVGYDINCGVRLMACSLKRADVQPRAQSLMTSLFRAVPTGVGSSGAIRTDRKSLRRLAVEGARWSLAQGYGTESDIAHIEEEGCMAGADPDTVSDKAWERGSDQVGTLGSGNHFLEVAYVSEVYDPAVARHLGLDADTVTVTIHCGSRGFGHQVCDDFLTVMDRAARHYGIALPDRQLACAPVRSPEGQRYLHAMRCAVNYAFANRQVIAHLARECMAGSLGMTVESLRLRTVYEVAHNIAKVERHTVEGRERVLCVHRKGATRAFPPGHPAVPADYRAVGQPVLIPGDMGRYSYVLVGTEGAMQSTFGSTCHGAGRVQSRTQAKKASRGRPLQRELEDRGIFVMAASRATLVEEAPEAYKDVSQVVEVVHRAGISRKVAKLRPWGVVKG
jgi:tRNA-splicing ligase RtcB